jgi:Ser/Thr protein kinase RdoA (MazF antagonist)
MSMGKVHVSLRGFGSLENDVTDEYLHIVARMSRYFKDKNVRRALKEKLNMEVSQDVFESFKRLLEFCGSLPDRQALHMDFVRGNLLFRGTQPGDMLILGNVTLSGILDFEKTAYGAPIIDVARTLAFLLVDCKYKSPEKIRKYFLYSGYNKRSGAETIPLDSELLDRLVALFLVYDLYKFFRHNPYESLTENEHFIRTRDMLLTLGMVRYTKR